jgi:hypothetical protein
MIFTPQRRLVSSNAFTVLSQIEGLPNYFEYGEALEQQTATSEVLGVISSSPTDLAPVFEIILTNATPVMRRQFCRAVAIRR